MIGFDDVGTEDDFETEALEAPRRDARPVRVLRAAADLLRGPEGAVHAQGQGVGAALGVQRANLKSAVANLSSQRVEETVADMHY